MIDAMFRKIKHKIDFFGHMTNLHGFQNIFSISYIPRLKRLFWLNIIVLSCLGAGLILQSALKLFSTSVASYSVETDYLDWTTPFPAVTICEQNDNGRTKSYINQFNKSPMLIPFYKDVAFWNVKYCRVCAFCKINVTCEEDFRRGIHEIRHRCSELLTDCWWGGRHFRCCDFFQPIATEYGLCYVFNSARFGNSSVLSVSRKIGLPDLVLTAIELVGITVHAPDDVVSVILENILGRFSHLPLITEFEVILKVEQTVNDASVQSLPTSMRGCLFKTEQPSYPNWPFKEYTYSDCLLYCRVIAQSSICNCTHHFLANIVDAPACDVEGLICLYHKKDEVLRFECNCPSACDDVQYKTAHIFYKRVAKPSAELISRGSRARIRLGQLPTLRVRRLAIKDTLGVVVDIGGVGGVFFGASLLSIIELFYLFFIRRN